MSLFTATFSAIGITAAQDVFEIAAPATKRIRIKEIRIGQYSDAGDAAAEMLSVLVIRGYTTTGTGGAAVTPSNLRSFGQDALSTVKRNNTTVAQDGTPTTLIADSFNIMRGWLWRPREEREDIILEVSQRLVVRITAPADSLTTNGTLLFQEIEPTL